MSSHKLRSPNVRYVRFLGEKPLGKAIVFFPVNKKLVPSALASAIRVAKASALSAKKNLGLLGTFN